MAYPHAHLERNVLAFCDGLRRAHGFKVGTGEALDALRALAAVDLADVGAARAALGLVLCASAAERAAFPALFDAFFFPGAAGVPQRADPFRPTERRPEERREPGEPGERGGSRAAAGEDEGDGVERPAGAAGPAGEGRADADAPLVRAPYGRLAAAGEPPPRLDDEEAALQAAAARLLERLRLGRARRLRPLPRGRRFDLRRSLRRSLAHGGELVEPRYLGRPPRHPRVVVLVDASRSMAPHAPPLLAFGRALARRSARAEVFVFSTALARVTGALRSGDGVLPPVGDAYGGGTRIGACLAAFVAGDGERLLGTQTLVVVGSDGLDVGEADVLRDAMRAIGRRSAGVVWLNPLLDAPGYAPDAAGMRAALPYVTTLACARDAAGFARLAATVRIG